MWGCTPTRTRRSPLNERVRRWPSCRPGHRSLLLHSGSGLSARFVDPRRRCWRKGLVMCPHKPARRCPAAASTSGAPTGLFRVRAWSLPGTARWAHVPIAAVEDRRRAGLVELLSNNPTIEIVGQALTRGEAVERARRHAPVSASRRRRRSSGGASQPSRRRGPDRAGGHAARASTGSSAARGRRRQRARFVCVVHASDGQRRLDPGCRRGRLPGRPLTGCRRSAGAAAATAPGTGWTWHIGSVDAA
jgi:hypothetical protein